MSTKTLIKRMNAARHFPANTCPASRHAQDIAEAMLRGRGATIELDEHAGESIAATVAALWEARTKIARLEAELANRETPIGYMHSAAIDALPQSRSEIVVSAAGGGYDVPVYARMIREAIGR